MTRKLKFDSFNPTGLNDEEAKVGKKLFDDYKKHYNIEQLSDLQILSELVYREVLQLRYKNRIAEIEKHNQEADQTKKDKKKQSSAYVIRSLNENLEQILTLKDKLGLFNQKKDNDGYKHLEILKKKFKIWLKENQASRTIVCPHCSKMLMLRMKTTAWDVQKHTMFRDRILCNDHLVKMFMERKITADDCAKVLGVSPAYIQWLIKKWYDTAKVKDSDTPTN